MIDYYWMYGDEFDAEEIIEYIKDLSLVKGEPSNDSKDPESIYFNEFS